MVEQQISHYQVLEKLGAGGMGEVYLAEDTKLKRRVALKFLPPEFSRNEEAKSRFFHEAQAAAALNHPNIVTVYEINEFEGQIYIAMEYVEGRTLKDLIDVGADPRVCPHDLPLDQAIDIAMQVAKGLQAAHDKGIVHRDIKPANIFIGKDNTVKILDFGIAKLAHGQTKLTKTGTTLGTVAYMSPEQCLGKDVDHRTDIWSLGVVLYEMLTGKLPFRGEYEQAMVYAIVNKQHESLEGGRKEISPELERTIDRALAKKVEERYGSVEEMTADLKKAAAETKAISRTEMNATPSIAVLPFLNMSADPENEYFSDGLSEEIINGLSRLRNLRVVARTSAFAFKGKELDIREIGRKLSVSAILEGSVRKAGNRLRITAQLINVADGFHLWSEQYDREMKDIFAIQDEIAAGIVIKLKVNLLGEERAMAKPRIKNIEAYQLFLRGRYLVSKMTSVSLYRAIECFEQVLGEAPDFAPAKAGMAEAYFFLGFLNHVPPRESFPKAKVMAQKAIAQDPSLAFAHSILGLTLLHYDWDWPVAEETLKRALALNAQDGLAHTGYGTYLLVMGKTEEAIGEYFKELNINPLAGSTVFNYGISLLRAGKLHQAIAHIRSVIEVEGGSPHDQWILGHALFLNSERETGIEQIHQAVAHSNRNPMILSGLGWAFAMNGQKSEAEEVIAELKRRSDEEHIRPYLIAKIYAGLKEADPAFAWLDQSFRQRDPSLAFILTDETLVHLHHDRRFNDLLVKLKLDRFFNPRAK